MTDSAVSTFPSLEEELIIEILIRLPIKSVLRCKCLSKQWYALINNDPYFDKMNLKHQKCKSRHRFLVESEFESETTVSENTTQERLYRIQSLDGLELEERSNANATHRYRIRNPATRQILDLPHPHFNSFEIICAHSDASNVYKLISFYNNATLTQTIGCEILTLGDDELSWRIITDRILQYFCRQNKIIQIMQIAEALHMVSYQISTSNIAQVVTINLENESVTTSVLPRGFFSDWAKVHTMRWTNDDHKKHLSFGEIINAELNVLVWENYNSSKFCERNIVVPLTFLKKYKELEGNLCTVLSTRKGKLIFLYGSEMIIYNIERNEIKQVKDYSKFLRMDSLINFKGMKPE